MSKKVKGSTSGIYVILCKANGKTRIGQASEIDRRLSQYRAELRGNKFNVKELQEDFNLYAEESFSFKIIERSPQKKLKELENYYILKYNAINYGYNTRLNDLSKPKKIRRGKEAANFSKERSFITGGELNGHYQTKRFLNY
jgi:group I intron endonuclease